MVTEGILNCAKIILMTLASFFDRTKIPKSEGRNALAPLSFSTNSKLPGVNR